MTTRGPWALGLGFCLSVACSRGSVAGDDGQASAESSASTGTDAGEASASSAGMESSGSEASTETESSTTAQDESESDTSSEASSVSTAGFVQVDQGGGWAGESCDIFQPLACPEGQKCTLAKCHGEDDDYFDCHRCRDIQGDAQAWAPCEVLSEPWSGNDDCAAGAVCVPGWPATGSEECRPLCTGDYNDPQCGALEFCSIDGSGIWVLCTEYCDPLAQDCDVGACRADYTGGFVCMLDQPGSGPYGTPCALITDCEAGTECVLAEAVPEPACAGEYGCCTTYCDIGLPNTCPGAGQQCLPAHDAADVAAGFEHVGLCQVPSP